MIRKRDDDRAKEAEKRLAENDGYCPCKVEKIPKNKCMCRDFKMDCLQIDFYDTCKCGLFEKVRDEYTRNGENNESKT